MIWNDVRLREWFGDSNINPASIDLCLGNGLCVATPEGWREPVQFDTYDLKPGEFVLCHSAEYVKMPTNAIGMLFSKSSTGRIGLEHLHAGYVDPGFHGELTFEFHNVAPWPITLVAGKRIMQLVMVSMESAPENDYTITGRYNGQVGPTPAR